MSQKAWSLVGDGNNESRVFIDQNDHVAKGLESRLRLKHGEAKTFPLAFLESQKAWSLVGDGNPFCPHGPGLSPLVAKGLESRLRLKLTEEAQQPETLAGRKRPGVSSEIETPNPASTSSTTLGSQKAWSLVGDGNASSIHPRAPGCPGRKRPGVSSEIETREEYERRHAALGRKRPGVSSEIETCRKEALWKRDWTSQKAWSLVGDGNTTPCRHTGTRATSQKAWSLVGDGNGGVEYGGQASESSQKAWSLVGDGNKSK